MSDADMTNETSVNAASRLLSEARQQLGMSQKEVADQLYLTTTFIQYIDDGEFERIPKPAFIKGYLRSYARVVGLDRDDIVQRYEADIKEATSEQVEIRGVTEERVGSAAITGPVLQTALAGLGGVILLVILVWLFAGGDDEPVPVATQPAATNPVAVDDTTDDTQAATDSEAPLSGPMLAPVTDDVLAGDETPMGNGPDPATDAEATAAEVAAEVDEPASTATADVADLVAPAAAAQEQDTPEAPVAAEEEDDGPVVEVERIIEDGVRYIIIDAGGTDELQFSFTDDCWVEIDDSQGDLLYGDLNRDGDILRLYAPLPVEILFGKATVVSALFNGEPFDLNRYTTRDETAKVTFRPTAGQET